MRGGEFHERGELGTVGIADDDMQAAEFFRIGVRLVPRVDHRAGARGCR